MTASQSSCSRCGTRLPGDLLGGLCEACLLRFSLGVGEPPPLSDDAAGASLFDLLDPSLPAGARRFGDYELLEEIGAGGMGVVWRARQRSLNRSVALKMIRAGQLARPEDVGRFRTEAEAVARLRHPGIVAIHEVGEVDGQQFFSMELAPGASLAQCVRQGPLAPRRAAAILQRLAGTIAHAHARGVLHRDLKPSNILLDAEDQPRVTDFGLAKIAGHASDITRTDAIVGSPGYMAPEQAAGRSRSLDGRADLHARGAILYELLTGRPPYQADSALATLKLVVETEPVSPRLLNPGIPRDLETICLKCLEKEPAKRYATAQEPRNWPTNSTGSSRTSPSTPGPSPALNAPFAGAAASPRSPPRSGSCSSSSSSSSSAWALRSPSCASTPRASWPKPASWPPDARNTPRT